VEEPIQEKSGDAGKIGDISNVGGVQIPPGPLLMNPVILVRFST